MAKKLKDVVTEACEANRRSQKKAVDAIIQAADAPMTREIILLGAKQLVRSYFSKTRGKLRRRDGFSDEELADRIEAKDERRAFMERYSLYGRQLIEDATVEDLLESAKHRRIMAAGNLKRAKFEEAVAKAMGRTTKTVSQFFSSVALNRIARKYDVN